MSAPNRKAFLNSLTLLELRLLLGDWPFWARPEQLPPPGDWRIWLFLGGRGAGKTRAGAEWVQAGVMSGQRGRIALLAPTFHDAREVMVDGVSGIRVLASPAHRPRYEATRHRLLWPNGAVAQVFSAEDPDGLRGWQFDAAWCDEFAAWRQAGHTLAMLEFGLRLGLAPQMMLTTTPRPVAALRDVMVRPDVAVTTARTADNASNLSPGFMAARVWRRRNWMAV